MAISYSPVGASSGLIKVDTNVYYNYMTDQYYSDPYGTKPISYSPYSSPKPDPVVSVITAPPPPTQIETKSDPIVNVQVQPSTDQISRTQTTSNYIPSPAPASFNPAEVNRLEQIRTERLEIFRQLDLKDKEINEQKKMVQTQERDIRKAETNLQEMERLYSSSSAQSFIITENGQQKEITKAHFQKIINDSRFQIQQNKQTIEQNKQILNQNTEVISEARNKMNTDSSYTGKVPINEFKTADQYSKTRKISATDIIYRAISGDTGKVKRKDLGPLPTQTTGARVGGAAAGVVAVAESIPASLTRLGASVSYAMGDRSEAIETQLRWDPMATGASATSTFLPVVVVTNLAILGYGINRDVLGVTAKVFAPTTLKAVNLGKVIVGDKGASRVEGSILTELNENSYLVTRYAGYGKTKEVARASMETELGQIIDDLGIYSTKSLTGAKSELITTRGAKAVGDSVTGAKGVSITKKIEDITFGASQQYGVSQTADDTLASVSENLFRETEKVISGKTLVRTSEANVDVTSFLIKMQKENPSLFTGFESGTVGVVKSGESKAVVQTTEHALGKHFEALSKVLGEGQSQQRGPEVLPFSQLIGGMAPAKDKLEKQKTKSELDLSLIPISSEISGSAIGVISEISMLSGQKSATSQRIAQSQKLDLKQLPAVDTSTSQVSIQEQKQISDIMSGTLTDIFQGTTTKIVQLTVPTLANLNFSPLPPPSAPPITPQLPDFNFFVSKPTTVKMRKEKAKVFKIDWKGLLK